MSYNGLTNQGLEYLTRCQVESKPVVFSKVKIGNGNIPMGSTGETTTDLYSFKKEIEILNKEQVENSIKMEILINNFDVLEEFYVKEIGVYVMDNDVEKLYWYINKDRPSPLPDKNTPSKHRYILHLETSQMESIILNYTGLDLMVDKEFVETRFNEVKERIKAVQFPNIESLKLKNLKVGDIVEVLGYYSTGDGAEHKRIIASEDDGSGVQLKNGLYANILHNGEVNANWFGAKGDGITDDTVNIKKAINYLKENNTLYFQQKTYLISCSANDVPMFEITKNNIVIKGSRATLKLINNHYTHYTFFKIYNANNVKISNLIMQGDRLEHDYKTMSGTHEFGYGIFIIGDNPAKPVNCIIENCYIYDMTGDAIVTKNGLSKGTIEINDCKIRKCRRQGISVLDSDIVIINNTDIQYIGTWDEIEGTSPMSCIDIEPASGTKRVELVVIKNSILKNATTYSLVGFPRNFKMSNTELCDMTFSSVGNELFQSYIDSCIFTYDENKKTIYTSFPDMELINCTFDYSKSKVAFADFGGHQTMHNCLIKGGLKSDGNRNTVVRLKNYGNGKKAIYNNCTFDNVEVRNITYDSKFNTFKNCFITTYNITPNISSSTFENCENNPIYTAAYNFYNCVIDRKFYPDNSVLNNTTVIEQPISLKLEKLSETYFAEKLKRENVYDDYIAYMDEKTVYDKQQKEIEKQRMLSYQEALKENPNLTYEEFMSLQPMTLNLIEEPQPSARLQEFMDKYL